MADDSDFQILVSPIYGPIQFREMKGSPRESFNPQAGFKVTRTFQTYWDDRWIFAQTLLGSTKRVKTEAVDSRNKPIYEVRRQLPIVYPAYPTSSGKVYPMTVDSIEGVSPQSFDTDNVYVYQYATITISYESVTFNLLEDGEIENAAIDLNVSPSEATTLRYVTRFYQPSAEALTLPHGSFKWVAEGSETTNIPVLGSHAIIISTAEVHYVWHAVPGRPSALKTHLGTVNSGVFDNFAAGTLLLLAAEYKPYREITGRRVADITYKMKHFSAIVPGSNEAFQVKGQLYSPERGHNYFLQYFSGTSLEPKYRLLTHNGNSTTAMTDPGIPVYRERNFDELFNCDDAVLNAQDDEELN